MRLWLWLLLGTLAGPAQAASTCYLYDGPLYWTCLREERQDEIELEELRDEIAQDARERLESAEEEE